MGYPLGFLAVDIIGMVTYYELKFYDF